MPPFKQQVIGQSNKNADEEPPLKRIKNSEPLPGPSNAPHTNISNSDSSCSSPDYSDDNDCDSSDENKKHTDHGSSEETKHKNKGDVKSKNDNSGTNDEKSCTSSTFLNKKVVKSAQLKKACLTLLGLLSRGQRKEKTLQSEAT